MSNIDSPVLRRVKCGSKEPLGVAHMIVDGFVRICPNCHRAVSFSMVISNIQVPINGLKFEANFSSPDATIDR